MNFDMYSNKQYNDDLDPNYIYPRPYIDPMMYINSCGMQMNQNPMGGYMTYMNPFMYNPFMYTNPMDLDNCDDDYSQDTMDMMQQPMMPGMIPPNMMQMMFQMMMNPQMQTMMPYMMMPNMPYMMMPGMAPINMEEFDEEEAEITAEYEKIVRD